MAQYSAALDTSPCACRPNVVSGTKIRGRSLSIATKSMILIIEGADLVGKSTLACRVSALTRWPIVKVRWALVGDPMSETVGMASTAIELLRATQPNLILDRAYFSWWAYGPVLGHDVSFMRERVAQFARVSDVTDCRLVVLTATHEELKRRYEREPDLYFPLDVIQAANARFPSLLELVPESLPSLHVDTTDTSPERLVSIVSDFLTLS